MAVIRCPNCGKENPDSLTTCQFCQAPLSSGLRIGDKPTKKNTGELEPVLPDWLRDMRQQARDSAEKDAAEAASLPKTQKEEPPDLLAGLASQSKSAEDDELPDWLTGLTSKKEEKPAQPAQPASDFFSQFEQLLPVQRVRLSLPSLQRRAAPVGQPPASPEQVMICPSGLQRPPENLPSLSLMNLTRPGRNRTGDSTKRPPLPPAGKLRPPRRRT